MKVLVTGARGFVGRNLCLSLARLPGVEILACDVDTPRAELLDQLSVCEFAFHLAGVNRPKDESEFRTGNVDFTEEVLAALAPRAVPVALASSIQAALDNPYGRSKRAAEEAVFAYAAKTGAPVYVYRFANVFGKWCRPNYNSAVATWCHNLARDLPIQVRDPAATVTLVYIDDVVADLVSRLPGGGGAAPAPGEILSVSPSFTRTLGEITSLLAAFRREPETLAVPDQADPFAKRLYATFLSYLPGDAFSYPLVMHADARGSFTEVLHSPERGQVSVNISHPGIAKGNHWHHTKHEKFCVVSGRGVVRFRSMAEPDAPVIDCRVSGERLEVVRIPPGYTHAIVNEGETDMVTLMWANEVFDPARPDTWAEKVED